MACRFAMLRYSVWIEEGTDMSQTSGMNGIGHAHYAIALAGAVTLIFAVTATQYQGGVFALLLLHLSSYALILLSWFWRPTFFSRALSLFLFLGFVVKLGANLVFRAPLVEPTGRFDFTFAAFDIVLGFAAAGFLGATIGHLLIGWFRGRTTHRAAAATTDTGRAWIALGALVLITLATAITNYAFAIARVGMLPQVPLPSIVQIAATFWMFWGAMLALSVVWGWLLFAGAVRLASCLILCAGIGSVISISMGSRGQIVLYLISSVLCILVWRRSVPRRDKLKEYISAFALAGMLVLASLLVVMVERSFNFTRDLVANQSAPIETTGTLEQSAQTEVETESQASETASQASDRHRELALYKIGTIGHELTLLVVMRWVGLEGVMAVSANDSNGWPLFWQALNERAQSRDSIYQQIAQSQYTQSDTYNFQTLAGAIAFFTYSGNHLIVFSGMAALMIICSLVEGIGQRLLASPLFSSLVGVALAYNVAQMTYPRSMLVILFQMVVAALVMFFVQWLSIKAGLLSPADRQPLPHPNQP